MKVSRYNWPADKKDRLALIVANLTLRVPPGHAKGRKGRPAKDELEDDEEEESTDGN